MSNTETGRLPLTCPHCGVYFMSGMTGICTDRCEGDRKAAAERQARMPATVDLDSIELEGL
jgi:hypothetical protein